ncbi:MAG: 2-oxoglutarate dehydrogenase subunit E1 [Pelagibacteraceae bacterium BACL20 MAG-120920-bin64]|jgi:2-oxoglutarate dehydrogenase E1 component|uniref:2-oxoglutarate dehydrogenase E1 component n=1 Tax=Candidatus Pelagibacter sp. TaxID=2024849 RepID=UPI0007140117|nr:MAG: 2-oxoglutarate dehydrogenase subunit E1 [Pelagibacteraceae bacterium BACL20 MAG-120920-bin64]
MSSSKNLEFEKTSFLSKSNSAFIEQMYVKFINKDKDLPESWQHYFEAMGEDLDIVAKEINGPSWSLKKKIDIDELQKKIEQEEKIISKENTTNVVSSDDLIKTNNNSIRAVALIRAYRQRGHLLAKLDPLGMMKTEYLDELHPDHYGFKKEDYNSKIYLDGVINKKHSNIREILEFLKKTYCGPIGYEYMHISNPVERKWIRDRIEKDDTAIQFTQNGKEAILNKLIQAEGFEKFLHTKYVGTKRFGLDGAESLIPSLEQIIKIGGQSKVKEIKIGMSHRGRLNVLANVLQKSYKRIFNEFAGDISSPSKDGAGDVKYHLGASSDREFDGNSVHVSLTDNPSHLEAVNPVVLGQTRAKQYFHEDHERNKVIPILIHGDAAFAGQGVVAECFAMSGLSGHNTGGAIHIIVNNQIGFTTSPEYARSSPYPSDVAKMVDAPILHVNGDDPEAVVYATRIATEFRLKFNRDVVIDLICYRRFGHNEGDEPSFTQPLMYKKIRSHPSPVEVYGGQLVNESTITEENLNEKIKDFKNLLDQQYKSAKDYQPKIEWFEGTWSRYKPERGKDKRGVSGYDISKLKEISDKICTIPSEKKIHKTIQKILEQRKNSVTKGSGIDWSTAEALAFGSLLEEGYPVRLVGQDSARGTFSQRHSVLKNQDDSSRYIPLNNISKNQKRFEVIDSFLSELAVLGFEYGYSLVEPNTLTLWEAQFGDFANGAQVVIDQFIASGERKWTRASGLVMLLPHGYEGQGPEHSSARLERFLQLCANDNLQVVNCTTPANYYHALRRQMHRDFRKPLIVMTPKSLLRNKLCVSNIEDFGKDTFFHRVLEDHALNQKNGFIELEESSKIKKVILCSGKVYFDLLDAREKLKKNNVVLYRIEQLYPFPAKSLVKELKKYAQSSKFYWCQEEPKNMGAWFSVRDYIQWTLDTINANNNKISYIGRSPDASTATGYAKRHISQQQEIINKVFE